MRVHIVNCGCLRGWTRSVSWSPVAETPLIQLHELAPLHNEPALGRSPFGPNPSHRAFRLTILNYSYPVRRL
jgi:hypothetical protein